MPEQREPSTVHPASSTSEADGRAHSGNQASGESFCLWSLSGRAATE